MDKLFLLLKEGLNKGILFFLTLYDTGFFWFRPFPVALFYSWPVFFASSYYKLPSVRSFVVHKINANSEYSFHDKILKKDSLLT